MLTFLYVADRNEGKLKGTDCINITSDPFEAKEGTNSTIHLSDTTMANNVLPTSMVNTGMCNLSLHIVKEVMQLVINRRLISVEHVF